MADPHGFWVLRILELSGFRGTYIITVMGVPKNSVKSGFLSRVYT